MFTKTAVAKLIANRVVSAGVAKVSKQIIVNHTEIDPDGITVTVAPFVVGEIVASKSEKHTDALVEAAISHYRAWKDTKNFK